MNTLNTLLIASLLMVSTNSVLAEDSPSMQAPTPQIDTSWALAKVESQVDADIAVQIMPSTAHITKEGNTWTYRQLINGQEIEVQITELAVASATKVAKRAVEMAMNMAGF